MAQPEIVISPASLAFGNTIVGEPKTLNISIHNVGLASLHVVASSSSPVFIVSQNILDIFSSLNTDLSVEFSPTHSGTFNGTITLTTNDLVNPTILVSVVGSGQQSVISLDKTTIDFSKVSVDDVQTQTLKITNTGTVDLIVSSIVCNNVVFSTTSVSIIAAGQSQAITVSFQSIAISTYTGTLTIISNASNGTKVVNLLAQTVSAGIFINKTSLNFGNTTINNTKTLNVLISNISDDNVNLVLSSIKSTNSVFSITISSVIISKNSVFTLPITFTPTTASIQSGQIQIQSNDTALPLMSIDLTGEGIVSSIIQVSTSLIDFGSLAIGTSLTKTFNITNTGLVDLIISSLKSSSLEFIVTPTSSTLRPNSTTSFQVAYTSKSLTASVATITIKSNDLVNSNMTISLKGQGLSPAIVVQGFDFGNVSIGEIKESNLLIQNTNNTNSVPLIISKIISNDALFTVNQTFPVTISSQSSIPVGFKPIHVGSLSTILSISSNDIVNPITNVTVTGTGVVPSISANPLTHDFSNVAVGQKELLNVTIKNLGIGDLVVSKVICSDSSYTASESSFTVLPAQSETITITFLPITSGSKPATVTLLNNDPNSPSIVLNLSGVGAYPVARVVPASLSFGNVAVNSTISQQFSISNSGTVSLNVVASSSNAVFTVSDANVIVYPNSTQAVTVTFSPTTVNNYSESISLTTNDPINSLISVSVTASSITIPKIVVSPTSLSFDQVQRGTRATLSINVSNQGSKTLLFSTKLENPVRLGLTPVFDVSPSSESVIVSGQTVLTVGFNPVDEGSVSGKLTINSNDLSQPSINVPLSGNAIATAIKWESLNPKLWIPKEIQSFTSSIKTIIDPLATALDTVTQVLDIVKLFVINVDDAMVTVLNATKSIIDNFIKSLEGTGIYVLAVLPGKQGINSLTNPEYYKGIQQGVVHFDPNNPSWFDCVKGGYSSFIAKVVNSFDDLADGNRPQFASSAMVGAYVMMFDSGTVSATDIGNFIKSIKKLTKIFKMSFKVAFNPPSNVTAFSSNAASRVTFSPNVADVLPKEFFVFRSLTKGGDVVQIEDSTSTYQNANDENGKPIRAWKLVGIIKPDLVKQEQAILAGVPYRMIFEDTGLTNDQSYYYVLAAGYTQISANPTQSDYNKIINLKRPTPIKLDVKYTTGLYTSDFETKVIASGYENPIPSSVSNVMCIGSLSAEVCVKPSSRTLIVDGGLARCRNFRCSFDSQSNIETFTVVTPTLEILYLEQTPNGGTVSINIERGTTTFTASSSTYRVDYGSKSIIITSPYYYKQDDVLTVTYTYAKALQTKAITDETGHLMSDQTYLTKYNPVDALSVKVFELDPAITAITYVPVLSSDVTVVNDKDGRIYVNRPSGTMLLYKYNYYSDFSQSEFFNCVKPEYDTYFFDQTMCNNGSTLCPGFDNANCYYNSGSSCKNTANSQRSQLSSTGGYEPENIPFNQFYDPIYCQNGMMKQRCDGYSKISGRFPNKTWPDWQSEQLSALDMFSVINDIMNTMDNLLNSLISGTSKQSDAITNFINLLEKKIDALKQLVALLESYIEIINDDFDIPSLYFLSIPFASGGNDYLKNSIQNSTNGPNSKSSSYTAGIVLAFGTAGIGDALKLFFG